MKPHFTWITIGVDGGLNEGNLNAHLIAPIGSTDFACLDAGTLLAGIEVANQKGCFNDIKTIEGLTVEGTVLHHHIKAYLLTHPYLDHVQGLVVASPNDSKKPIMSLKGVIDDIESHLFNWRIWPNFGNRGVKPVLNQYQYLILDQGKKAPIPETSMNVEALPLAHGEHTESAAFLVESSGKYILYMGDTGPDEVEKRTTTEELWNRIAPLIREDRVHAISIETSYVDERPDDLLFSHLTPSWLMKAFRKLASIVDQENPRDSLRGLKVLITHIKPDVKSEVIPREIIQKQLQSHNDLGLDLLFIEQGKRYEF